MTKPTITMKYECSDCGLTHLFRFYFVDGKCVLKVKKLVGETKKARKGR
jgi:hypothetical protein